MRIGVVSGSGVCIPLLYQFKTWGEEVELFFGDLPYTDKDRDSVPIFCSSHQVKLVKETQKSDLYAWADRFKPDLVFVSGYSHKIEIKKLKSIKHGIYNIHFGKLPEYRGPNPVFWQLKNSEPLIGLCIHQLSSRFDAGPIAWQQDIKNEIYYNYTSVNQLFSNLQVQGVLFILSQLKNGEAVMARPQDEKKARYHPKPQLNDVLIRWQSMNAQTIIDLVKACNSWNYGAITSLHGLEVKILDVAINDQSSEGKVPGTITRTATSFSVACRDGKSLEIGFLSINGVFLPGRHAGFYGVADQQRFST
jgi:methionyl-tRNA formyltransferase